VDAWLARERGWLNDVKIESMSPTSQCPGSWLRRLQ
jgi:hypothetical protein